MVVTAMEHRGVVGEGFQSVALPAASESARFLDAGNNQDQKILNQSQYIYHP
jgi:hypothetical protein